MQKWIGIVEVLKFVGARNIRSFKMKKARCLNMHKEKRLVDEREVPYTSTREWPLFASTPAWSLKYFGRDVESKIKRENGLIRLFAGVYTPIHRL